MANSSEQVNSLKGFGDYAARTIATMYGHFDKVAIDSSVRSMFAALHNNSIRKPRMRPSARATSNLAIIAGLSLWLDNKRYWSANN